ncbi:hypothetical protein [Halalkalicoccus tibetensis]|uniref:DUF5611 domain-containing protein n=1 Tax=Halalkalicoccus tibetensis TaxID=175632 RepID=A0ABD5V366_9EURY
MGSDPTDSNINDSSITKLKRSENYTEQFVEEGVVVETEDHVIIDFQKTNADFYIDEEGNLVEFGGERESSARLHMSFTAAEKLAANLAEFVEEREKVPDDGNKS